VEASAAELIIIADASKKVPQLGIRFPVPVEVVRFGWKTTLARVEALGCTATLRRNANGDPYLTDEQHYILDCQFGPMADPAKIADQLKGTVGVVEHGLFIGMAKEAIIALPTGIETLQPS